MTNNNARTRDDRDEIVIYRQKPRCQLPGCFSKATEKSLHNYCENHQEP